MAIGWFTVLKMVPWGDVIESAPKVALGAKKLWHSVGVKPTVAPSCGQESGSDSSLSLVTLHKQVTALQVATTELQQQMLDSSALIGSLAEQNSQLIKRLEVQRKRTLWLACVVLIIAVVFVNRFF